jgi:hypothetical protein
MNDHLHPLFKRILEPLMKPRTQEELDQWNAGARRADATWWQQPHERGVGRTYKRVCIGALKDSNIPVYEQIEDWK